MSELIATARLRVMADNLLLSGDPVGSANLVRIIIEIDNERNSQTEHLRLKEEECKQLQQDKAELVELVESAYIEGCHDGYGQGLGDGQNYTSVDSQSWTSSKNSLEPDESWNISESKAKLEKHKFD